MCTNELRPKLVSAHPFIPLWYEKCMMMWNRNFCKNKFSFCYSDISNSVVDTVWNITIPRAKTNSQKMLFSHNHAFHFFTNQKFQLWFVLVIFHVLLYHLFHTPKCIYRSHPYVGVIQISIQLVFNCYKNVRVWTSCPRKEWKQVPKHLK